jgi:two-component system NtrC family sensor kinase
VGSSDEFGLLAASFNRMAEELGQAYGQLQDWGRRLEDRVHEKTEELEKAHKGMIHSEKMASLGKLAATVAHEVNNPLFGMLTYARLTMKEVVKSDLPEDKRKRILEYQEIIDRESKRCGELMKGLLTFARQSPPQHAMTQLNTIVARAQALVTHQYALAQIELIVSTDPALPGISCDPDQIQQVLIVLLVNACGRLPIRTHTLDSGQGVLISVRDTGPGISSDVQAQIFEPFFSTKDDQHRTGLGLAVARGIVDRHGGTITVESKPGEGAEFRVQLPLSTGPQPTSTVARETT